MDAVPSPTPDGASQLKICNDATTQPGAPALDVILPDDATLLATDRFYHDNIDHPFLYQVTTAGPYSFQAATKEELPSALQQPSQSQALELHICNTNKPEVQDVGQLTRYDLQRVQEIRLGNRGAGLYAELFWRHEQLSRYRTGLAGAIPSGFDGETPDCTRESCVAPSLVGKSSFPYGLTPRSSGSHSWVISKAEDTFHCAHRCNNTGRREKGDR
ncbi:hypothetical protein LTR49_004935 [Elasticomyces elasticus]|nr:hypothetical protein LTR49_004935 [Elasticomyces elasticus]